MPYLIQLADPEPNGEGSDRFRGLLGHQRGDQAGIDAAGQQAADGHIGDHADTNGVAQQRVQLILVCRLAGSPRRETVQRDIFHIPV